MGRVSRIPRALDERRPQKTCCNCAGMVGSHERSVPGS